MKDNPQSRGSILLALQRFLAIISVTFRALSVGLCIGSSTSRPTCQSSLQLLLSGALKCALMGSHLPEKIRASISSTNLSNDSGFGRAFWRTLSMARTSDLGCSKLEIALRVSSIPSPTTGSSAALFRTLHEPSPSSCFVASTSRA